jgi:hypothetical protein
MASTRILSSTSNAVNNKVTAPHVHTALRVAGTLLGACLLVTAGVLFAQSSAPAEKAPVVTAAGAPLVGMPAGPGAAQNPVPAAGAPGAAAPKTAATAAAINAKSAPKPPKAPEPVSWEQMTPEQKVALEPLSHKWNTMANPARQKWLGIAKVFASLRPEEQQRMHEKMHEFVGLTAEERRLVRENFSRSKTLDPSQKSAQWEQYRQLPEEEKKKLAAEAASASTKKKVTALPSPSQPQIKTVAPVKRASTPDATCPAGAVKNPAAATPACVSAPAGAHTVAPPSAPAAPAVPVTNAK